MQHAAEIMAACFAPAIARSNGALVTGDEVKVRRTVAEIVEDAVATFLARYGA